MAPTPVSPIKEVNVLADFNLTLDHFYSLIKPQLGNLTSNQYIQLQLAALPLDVSLDYPWFSLGNLNFFFDHRLDPIPVSGNLSTVYGATLSREYGNLLSEALSLVEEKELDPATKARIDALEVEIENLSEKVGTKAERRLRDWQAYCAATMTNPGDMTVFNHWSQGHILTTQIVQLQREMDKKGAMWVALRDRSYGDPDQRAILEAFAAYISAASRMRYPRFEDSLYGDEAKKFNVVYFASLPDNDSGMFANRQMMTSKISLTNLVSTSIGSVSDEIIKKSSAKSSITTDWSASGSGGWGPFKVSASVSSHEVIKSDFSSVGKIGVSTRSTIAIPIDATPWFNPSIFNNSIIVKNRKLFERYLGANGTLLYYPSHLVVARGVKLTFHSQQDWQWDYEHNLKVSGGGSASFFGISFGASAGHSKHETSQIIERRGHDLILDDGEKNIRILGFIAVKNDVFSQTSSALTQRFQL